MIGRDRELAELRAHVQAVQTSAVGRVVVVEGEAGIGKSTLVAALASTAQMTGFRRLRCTGLQREALAGFAALHELLHPVLGQVDALPPRQRGALLTAFGLQEGPAPDRLLIALAVLGLLEEVAATQPLLVVVEDLPWLDASSAEVIGFVARRLDGARILLVATARTSTAPLERGAEVLESAAAARLLLRPLTPQDSEQLLDTLTGPAPALGAAARRRVLREAGGNPLAVREFVNALRARGLDEQALEVTPLPTTRRLEAAFLGEVADLPAASRTLLLLAAADEDLPLPEVLSAGRRLGLAPQDLTPLERADLVSVVGGRLQLRHPLLRSAVYGAASSIERVEVHRVLASSVGDSGRAAWHRAAATVERDESVAAELDAAAARAAERGARAEAAAALHRAAELSPEVDQQARRLVQAAELARQGGSVDQALQHLAEAEALPLPLPLRFRSLETRTMLSTATGQSHGDAAEHLALARALGGPGGTDQPEQRVAVLTAAAYHAINRVTDQVSRRAIRDELAAIDLGRWDPVQEMGLSVLDPLGRAEVARPALPSLLASLADHPYPLLGVAQMAEHLQDLSSARAAWTRTTELFHRSGSPGDAGQSSHGLAILRLIAGQLPEALLDAENAARTSQDLGLHMITAGSAAIAALVHVWAGRTAEAAEAVRSSRELFAGGRVPQVAASIAWAAGLLALDEHRYHDALAELRAVAVHPVYEQWVVADLTEAAVRSGEPEAAHALVTEVARAAEVLRSSHLLALVHRSRALLAAAGDAEAHYRASLSAGADGDAPLEQARTHLLYGEWLRRGRRVREAREHLGAALSALEAVGAGGGSLAARARAELRAAGTVPAARTAPQQRLSDLTSILTSQELQIARLAAEGLTNKEIADRIYLSHRTVSSHLYKVFPKLGIANRHQLRDALGQDYVPLQQR